MVKGVVEQEAAHALAELLLRFGFRKDAVGGECFLVRSIYQMSVITGQRWWGVRIAPAASSHLGHGAVERSAAPAEVVEVAQSFSRDPHYVYEVMLRAEQTQRLAG